MIQRKSILECRKAQLNPNTFGIFEFMITAFLVVIFFAGLIYAMGLINTVMHNVGLSNEVNVGTPTYVNMTKASDDIFGQMNQSIQALRMVAIVYILALAVSLIITNALMKIHPLFFFVYAMIALLGVIFAPVISNAYETLLSSGMYDNGLTGFTSANYILLNLPTAVMIIGLLGGIFLFINLIRTGNETSGL